MQFSKLTKKYTQTELKQKKILKKEIIIHDRYSSYARSWP